MLAQVQFSPHPPPPKAPNVGLMVGWAAVVAMAGGIFYYTLRGPVRANRPRRNPKLVGNPDVRDAVSDAVRFRGVTLRSAGAPSGVVKASKALPEGVYRIASSGDVTVYRSQDVPSSLITSVRIAATKSSESQVWLVKVARSPAGRLKRVPIRGYRKRRGRVETVFRIEEA
jgi:hypothetical protein